MKKHLIILLVLMSLLSAQPLMSDSSESRELSVYFLGNSYTFFNQLPEVLVKLGQSARPAVEFRVGRHTPGGATLEMHNRSQEVEDRIKSGKWNLYVLQEQSTRPILGFEKMKRAALALGKKIKSAQPGARIVFFMTWPGKKKPHRMEALEKAYRDVSRELGAGVAPVGLAWMKAIKARPELDLYDPDGSHPNVYGTYLSACVFYAVITGRSPIGLSNGGFKRISAEDCRFLQTIAAETVAMKSR